MQRVETVEVRRRLVDELNHTYDASEDVLKELARRVEVRLQQGEPLRWAVSEEAVVPQGFVQVQAVFVPAGHPMLATIPEQIRDALATYWDERLPGDGDRFLLLTPAEGAILRASVEKHGVAGFEFLED